jgi:hypothetical protein
MTSRELLALAEGSPGADELAEGLLTTGLGYVQTNGSEELRARIAALYPGAGPENVLVTNGTSEANYVAAWSTLEPGDELVLMLPNYMQIWGIARAFGAQVKPFRLREELNWAPDPDELPRLITDCTRMIAVCNPNNPTGAVLSEEVMDAIVRAASRVGAWLLSDEVYQGAERVGETTPSFWGRYERVVVTNGLSKAYGLPGLRVGWIAGPAEFVARAWSYHDYITISPSMLSDYLARVALHPQVRSRILERTRGILRTNYPILESWVADHGEAFTLFPPRAGAIAWIRYHLDVNSTELVERLLRDKSVLIVAGDHFGMDGYLRIGYGPPADYLRAGLDRLHETVMELQPVAPGLTAGTGCHGLL